MIYSRLPILRIFHKNFPRRGLRGTGVPDILNKSPERNIACGETVESRQKRKLKRLQSPREVDKLTEGR
jgi:hypothetical protein